MPSHDQPSSTLPTREMDPGRPAHLRDEGIDERNEVFSRTILEILLAPKMYAGKRIRFEGMIVQKEKLKTCLGGEKVPCIDS